MSKERPQSEPTEPFGFTERERLYDRISHQRFIGIIADEQTAVHKVEVSSNTYGEFLFVSTSRVGEGQRVYITFYGAGYHDYRERWITDEWFWYEAYQHSNESEPHISNEEAMESIQQRQDEIATYKTGERQSKRGQLFEFLAEILDEDGALSEMEDLGNLTDLLEDDWE
jgi:hypothetical protein